jgi:hypothetical protein
MILLNYIIKEDLKMKNEGNSKAHYVVIIGVLVGAVAALSGVIYTIVTKWDRITDKVKSIKNRKYVSSDVDEDLTDLDEE